ncbi:MAG: Yip1 family protein [Caulobacterales bacterium]|jgi:hypothetical protein
MTAGDDNGPSAGQRLREAWRGVAKQKSEFILSRAWGLFTDPVGEWTQIRDEKTSIPSLLLGYVTPVAAAPTFAGMLGQLVFGEEVGGERVRPEFLDAFANAVITCLSVIALVYLIGLLINVIAEQFDADRNEMNALKVAAFTPTPVLVTGLAAIYPPLWWVGVVGLGASAFLLYRGLPILMRCPEERALGFSATVTIVALIALVLILALSGCVMGAG